MIWQILVALIIVLYIYYEWTRRHLTAAARKYRGPTPLPILGNGLLFLGKTEGILQKMQLLGSLHNEAARFWLGSQLFLIFKQPQYIEKILTSSKFSQKHQVYNFLKEFGGEGLISASSGPMHKQHRRMIQSLFDMSLIEKSVPIIQEHVTTCLNKLEKMVDKGLFDIEPYIHKCFIDIIQDILFGDRANCCQQREYNQFEDAFNSLPDHIIARLTKVWLHPDVIYKNTPMYKKSQEIYNIFQQKINKVTSDSWNRRKDLMINHNEFIPLVDQIADNIEKNPGVCDFKTFEQHLLSLYVASENPLTLVSSFTTLCLGMYPEYQNKAAEEIRHIFGTVPMNVTLDDIKKANYVDMCCKDVMRLFLIAPYIVRQSSEDVVLDGYPIPRGAAVIVSIFDLHRDEEVWQNPHHFYPDHFLPENVKKRHPYSYIPFSMGSRGCIAKLLAHHAVKLFLCNLLQRFEVCAEGKVPDLELKMDISVRPKNGYNLRLKRRIWLDKCN